MRNEALAALCAVLDPAWRSSAESLRRPRTFSKQHGHSDDGWLRQRRRHNGVTTRCEFGELTGDGLRRFPLVRPVRESLRDNQIQPLPGWGSSGRRFKSCQPDYIRAGQRRFRRGPGSSLSGKTAVDSKAGLRQLTPIATREQEDRLLRVIAPVDGTRFPSTVRLTARNPVPGQQGSRVG
jgi:hypothetical protein